MGLFGTFRLRWQRLAIASVVFCIVAFSIVSSRGNNNNTVQDSELRKNHRALRQYIRGSHIKGGGMFALNRCGVS
jgi:hypothetical protein